MLDDPLDRLLAQNVVNVSTPRRRQWFGFAFAIVAVVLAVPAFIAGIGFVAYQVQTVGEYGRCPTLLPLPCTDVPVPTLERISGLTLPQGTQVISSSSSDRGDIVDARRTTKATVRLPVGAASPLPAGSIKGGDGSSTQYSTVDGSIERQFVQHTDRDGRIVIDMYMDIETV